MRMLACRHMNESVGGSVATHAPTLDLHEIQATVLRQRPAPYFGTHVLLRVDDARAGREFLAPADASCRFRSRLVERGDAWLAVGISYAGLEALGVPAGFPAKLS